MKGFFIDCNFFLLLFVIIKNTIRISMKATALILIFSGLMGLNKCSSEIKIDFPIILKGNDLKPKEIKTRNVNNQIFIFSHQGFIFNATV